MKRTSDHLLLAFGVVAPLAVSMYVLFMVPRYREVWASFGAELPISTKMLLATFQWWGLLALLSVAIWWLWPTRDNRSSAAAIFGCVLSAILFLFCLFACNAAVSALADAASG
jgi:type II secretory pathway component PulF